MILLKMKLDVIGKQMGVVVTVAISVDVFSPRKLYEYESIVLYKYSVHNAIAPYDGPHRI